MEAVAKTFRYLDDDEIAAQRKAKEAQKSGDRAMSIRYLRLAAIALSAGVLSMLSGCGGNGDDDLRKWMAEQGASARGRLEPIRPCAPEAFTYNAFDQADPFKPRKIETGKGRTRP